MYLMLFKLKTILHICMNLYVIMLFDAVRIFFLGPKLLLIIHVRSSEIFWFLDGLSSLIFTNMKKFFSDKE